MHKYFPNEADTLLTTKMFHSLDTSTTWTLYNKTFLAMKAFFRLDAYIKPYLIYCLVKYFTLLTEDWNERCAV